MLVRTSRDKNHPYVTLNKTFIEDTNLSLKAIGLLAFCMAKPDGWKFYVSHLATVLKEKERAINSAFKELITYGYCLRYKTRTDKGAFDSQEYILFETPQNPEELKKLVPQRGFPDVDNPAVGNARLVSNNSSEITTEDVCIVPATAPDRFCEITTTSKEKIKVSHEELMSKSILERKDWTREEIDSAWSILTHYTQCVNDWFLFIEGTIKNIRLKQQNTKFMEKKCLSHFDQNAASLRRKGNYSVKDMSAPILANYARQIGLSEPS